MENKLAIFDWEGAIVCKHYGEALAAQNYLHTITGGNLPIPSAYQLAARFQDRYLGANPAKRTEVAIELTFEQAEGLLSTVADPEDIHLCFGGPDKRRQLGVILNEKGVGDKPFSTLLPVIQKGSTELLPQSHHGNTNIVDFTPNQILEGMETLGGNTDNRRYMTQAVIREEDKYSANESEPVYPGIIEEIEKLRQDGYQLALVHRCSRLASKTQKEVADLFNHHELCGRKGINYKPNPVILRNCIRAIGDEVGERINDLIGNTFYICSGYDDGKMALTTQANGKSVGSIHCLYSADDHRLILGTVFKNGLLGMVKIHPQRVTDEKKGSETRAQTQRRLAMKYCHQNLSFATTPKNISSAIGDLKSRRDNDEDIPLGISE